MFCRFGEGAMTYRLGAVRLLMRQEFCLLSSFLVAHQRPLHVSSKLPSLGHALFPTSICNSKEAPRKRRRLLKPLAPDRQTRTRVVGPVPPMSDGEPYTRLDIILELACSECFVVTRSPNSTSYSGL